MYEIIDYIDEKYGTLSRIEVKPGSLNITDKGISYPTANDIDFWFYKDDIHTLMSTVSYGNTFNLEIRSLDWRVIVQNLLKSIKDQDLTVELQYLNVSDRPSFFIGTHKFFVEEVVSYNVVS